MLHQMHRLGTYPVNENVSLVARASFMADYDLENCGPPHIGQALRFGEDDHLSHSMDDVGPSPAGKPRRVFHWTDANDGVPDKYFLGCRIQPMRGATCDFCATCDFWTLKRD